MIDFKYIQKIKYLFLTIRDLIDFLWFILVWGCNIKKLINQKKPIWIFADRGDDAGDNGFVFFEYVVKKHPEIDSYFVISKKVQDGVDYKKVVKVGNILHTGSKKHKLYFLASAALISSQVYGQIEPWRARVLNRFCTRYKYIKKVFLQHGVISNNLAEYYGKGIINVDIFICGARPEYEYVLEKFGFDASVIKYTGLARYDNLHNAKTKRQILLMPTWRKSFFDLRSGSDFLNTEYYQYYQNLINNNRLHSILRDYEVELIFYPHNNVQKMLHCFSTTSRKVTIAGKYNHNVHALLKSANLLITDYSSVFFDFAYMHKPIIYYQFDKKDFFKKHHKRGYFDYQLDGFGEIVIGENKLVDNIEKIIKNNFEIESKYKKRIDGFFQLYDKNNCKRIFDVIKEN